MRLCGVTNSLHTHSPNWPHQTTVEWHFAYFLLFTVYEYEWKNGIKFPPHSSAPRKSESREPEADSTLSLTLSSLGSVASLLFHSYRAAEHLHTSPTSIELAPYHITPSPLVTMFTRQPLVSENTPTYP